MHRWFIWAVLCMGVSVGFSAGREEGASGGQQEKETAPNGRGIGTLDHPVHGPGKALERRGNEQYFLPRWSNNARANCHLLHLVRKLVWK